MDLRAVEEVTFQVIQRALQMGDVIIITNAEIGWVELSARRFMPVRS